MLGALGRIGGHVEQVREDFAGVDALDPEAADEQHNALHGPEHALTHTRDGTPGEARRTTEILEHTTAKTLTADRQKHENCSNY